MMPWASKFQKASLSNGWVALGCEGTPSLSEDVGP